MRVSVSKGDEDGGKVGDFLPMEAGVALSCIEIKAGCVLRCHKLRAKEGEKGRPRHHGT